MAADSAEAGGLDTLEGESDNVPDYASKSGLPRQRRAVSYELFMTFLRVEGRHQMRNASGDLRDVPCETAAVPELDDARRDGRGQAQPDAEPGRECRQHAETCAEDGDSQRHEAKS